MANMPVRSHVYEVRVTFFCDKQRFASEVVLSEISDDADVWGGARLAAESSVYFNELIPDLNYEIEFLPPDVTDPAAQGSRGALKPVCSSCGSDTLVRDACVRWDIDSQAWALSDGYECTICDLCGSERDDLAKWVPASDITPLEQFRMDLAAAIAVPGIADDPAFSQFCFDHYLTQTVDEAVATWTASSHQSG